MKRFYWLLSPTLIAGFGLFLLMLLMGASAAQAAPDQAPSALPPPRPAARTLQQSSTPVYTVTDSASGDVDFEWIEIRGNGGVGVPGLAPIQDGSDLINIGFYFPFYENVYNQVRVSANGYLYFGNSGPYGGNTPNQIGPSDPNNMIAAFGAFLFLPQAERIGGVYYRQDTFPERRFIVEYVNAQWCCGLNEPHTFQIILYPDGRIKVQYRQVRFLTNAHEYVVAGIEDSTGSASSVEYTSGFFDQDPTIQNDLAVLYDPGNTVFGHLFVLPSQRVWWEDPGQSNDFDFDIVNLTGVTTTFYVTYSLEVTSSAVPTPSLWPVGVPFTVPVVGSLLVPIANTFDGPFEVTATIPVTATRFDRAALHLTVTSATSATISTTLNITYGVADRDLVVDKGLDPNVAPGPGGYFRYELSVQNDATPINPPRPAPARGVVVTDTLPLSTTLLGIYPSQGSVVTGTVGSQTLLTWTVGDLGIYDGEELYLVMRTTSALTVGDTVTNLATTAMTGSLEYGPRDNNSVTHTFTIVSPTVVYDIDKYPANQGVGPGGRADFVIYYDNAGSVPVTGTIIVDQLPISTTLAQVITAPSVADYSYDAIHHTLVFTIDPLRNGDWWPNQYINVAVTTNVDLAEGTVLTNAVSITTAESIAHLFDYQDDADSATITIIDPRADPFVDKRAPEVGLGGGVIAPEPGGDYTFWINYGNAGNMPATNVVLTDTLPESFISFLDVVDFSGNAVVTTTPGLLVWEPMTLPAGADLWARVDLYIHPNTPSGATLVNGVVITATGGDNITTTNDSDVVTVTLRGADVTVDKRVTPPGSLQVGDRLTYTLHFSHVGDPLVEATGVVISDRLPLGLTDIGVLTESDATLVSGGSYPGLYWTADELAYGEGGTITITAEVDAGHVWPARPTLLNRALISTVKLEPYGHAPNSDVVTNAVDLPSPYVLKTGPTIALPGDWLTYTIRYGNPGRLDAEGVCLTDTLPVSTTYFADTAGLTTTAGAGTVAWEVGTLPAGADEISFTLVLSLSADIPEQMVLENTAVLTTTSYDGDPGDNESRWRTPIGFDLTPSYKLVNGGSGATVDPGDVVTYTVVMSNAGPFSATNVSLIDLVPDGTTYVPGSLGATDGGGGYLPPPTNAISWTGAITGYGTVSVTFLVTVDVAPQGTVIWNEAVISDTANGIYARVPITLTGPDLAVSVKEISSAGPATGERVTYTIALSNSGELNANATVTDDLPVGVIYTGDGSASSGMAPVESGGTITWTGTVTAGEEVWLTIPVTVVALPGSLVSNQARIADGTGLVHVRAVDFYASGPDLTDSAKTVDQSNVEQGEQVEYRLHIYNNGSGPGIGLWMNDTAPPGVTFGAAYFDGLAIGSLVQNGNTITWTGDLALLGEVNIRVPATVTAAPGSDPANAMVLEGPPGSFTTRTAPVHVYWPADLSDNSKTVDKDEAELAETLRYTVTVSNAGELPGSFSVTDTLDANTRFGGFVSWGGNAPNESGGQITWSGTVDPGAAQQLVFTATILPTVSPAVTNVARIDTGVGGVYTCTARTDLVEPELSAIKRNSPAGDVYAGRQITYTIVMSNLTGGLARAWLTDPIPANTTFVPPGNTDYTTRTIPLLNALSVYPFDAGYDPPRYHVLTNTITWRGDIPASDVVTITFVVWVSNTVPGGTLITNTAWVDDLGDADPPLVRQVFNRVVWHQLYLPLVSKE